MEDNFRNALIIISAVVIIAIFVHGFWTIRKNKNPYKLKAKNEKMDPFEPVERGFDGSGFDQDGVSKPRVVSNSTEEQVNNPSDKVSLFPEDELLNQGPHQIDEAGHVSVNECNERVAQLHAELSESGNTSDSVTAKHSEQSTDNSDATSGSAQEQNLNSAAEIKIEKPEPSVYQAPVTQAKPVKKVAVKKTKKDNVKRNQMEINFGADLEFDEVDNAKDDLPAMSAIDPFEGEVKTNAKSEPKIERPTVDPEVIIISVVMPENQEISGAALLPTLLTLGLRYGDMNIFHRHEDNAGNGKVTFSLANMMNPGTFDLDNIETFSTQGVTLFMTLPNASDAFEVFQFMLNAAKQLALEFHGQLLDDKRSVMTKQTEQHYIGKIREFERKNRIATA